MAACSVALGKCNWVQSGAKVRTGAVGEPGVLDRIGYVQVARDPGRCFDQVMIGGQLYKGVLGGEVE